MGFKNNSSTSIKKNIILAILAQGISLIVSFILNLIVPKFISQYQYSYWQSYILYVGYVGVIHFGLLDGIVLRYSQYDYNEIDKNRIRSQFQILFFLISIMAIFSIIGALIFLDGLNRLIAVFVAFGMILKNVFTYSSYSFQITNRINKYAGLLILQRLAYGIAVIVLLICKVDRFEWYCLADLFGDTMGILFSFFFNRGMYFGKALAFKESIKEWWVNVSSGCILLFSNWSALLLLGSAKMIIQWRWDELIFGQISFSFSLSNLILTFISAISIVLFPSLKRMEQDKLPQLYKKIRNTVSPLLFFIMLFYFPGCWILKKFLPAYENSLTYLGILLPIVIYSSKVNLLTNNYLKAYRKEKNMLWVNIISILIAVFLFTISAYLFNNLTAVLVCVVIAVMLNSILSEITVTKIIHIKFLKEFILEAIVTILFILIANYFELWIAFGLYIAVLIVYFLYERETLFAISIKVKNIFRRKKQ